MGMGMPGGGMHPGMMAQQRMPGMMPGMPGMPGMMPNNSMMGMQGMGGMSMAGKGYIFW